MVFFSKCLIIFGEPRAGLLLFFIGGSIIGASLMAQMVKRLPAMGETRFDPQVGKISWRRKWHPTPVFLPGKSHGRRSLVGYCPWGCKESDTTERLYLLIYYYYWWFRRWLSGKESTCQHRRHEFDPWVKKMPGGRNGNPLQYSCLGNPVDRGALWIAVHGVEKSQT